MKNSPYIKYVQTNFDSLAIVTVLARIAFQANSNQLGEEDLAVLAALKRAVPDLEDASFEEVQSYLQLMDESQLMGLTSNVKGVLHEMEFVRVENEDGDSVYASYFETTNHPDTDIQLVDEATGEVWEVQLKATDNATYVQDWIDRHPDGEILVTEEIADRLDLETSRQSNAELTADVDQLVDKLISEPDSSGIWDYFPALTSASISIVVWQLWERYRQGQISLPQFKRLAAHATGLKIAKLSILTALLAIPVVGQVTGAVLIARLLLTAREAWFERKAYPVWRVVPQNHKLLPGQPHAPGGRGMP